MAGISLITGSNGGIGLAVSEHLLSRGERNLAFHYRTSNAHITQCLARFGLDPSKHLFKADLCNEEELNSMRRNIESKLGRVLGLVNVAGASSNSMSWKTSLSDFKKVIDDNLTSTFLSCREFIPGMREAGSGRIINISSIVAFTGTAGAAHYAAAKGGIISFTKSLSLELAPKNITANALALGFFEYGIISHLTPEMQSDVKSRIPLKRFGNAQDIGSYIHFLLSESAGFTTGQTIHINGGLY
jgi:3-oxoacyl-[acyl-carrier protein] reductase